MNPASPRYFALAGYYLAVGDVGAAVAYLVSTAVFVAMMLVWVVAAMPKSIQANGGRGSSHCYDLCARPARVGGLGDEAEAPLLSPSGAAARAAA